MIQPNKVTGVNAGGPRQLPMRTRWAARVADHARHAAAYAVKAAAAAAAATEHAWQCR